MNGEEIAGLVTQGLVNGLLQGALIFAPYFIGFCILCLLISAVKRAFRRRKAPEPTAKEREKLELAYQPRPFFSPHEKDAYRKLKEIADRRGYIIFAKVRLLDLLEPVKNHPNYRALFNKVQAKHVDFVLCNYELSPYIVIELDDSSHDTQRRKERDQFIDEALTQCGYRILHTREITNNILNDAIPQR